MDRKENREQHIAEGKKLRLTSAAADGSETNIQGNPKARGSRRQQAPSLEWFLEQQRRIFERE
jgi:hypothetical protein